MDATLRRPWCMRIRFGLRGAIQRGDSGCARARRFEGEFYPFRNEARDGAESIAWLRARPESNGRVGCMDFLTRG